MKFKKILIFMFILITLVTMGVASASEDADFNEQDSNPIVSEYNDINLNEIESENLSSDSDEVPLVGNDELIETVLTADDVNATYHSSERIVVNLNNINGVPVPDAHIVINYGESNETTITDEIGVAEFSLYSLKPGNYTPVIVYGGDERRAASNITVNVEVFKVATDITLEYDGDFIIANLTDVGGNALADARVGFAIADGVFYNMTDENGLAKYSTKGLDNGNYTAQVAFFGDDYYEKSPKRSINVVIDKIVTILTSADVNVVCSDEDYLVATLKDEEGNAVVGARVGFALDGVTYIYTDENGDAKYPTKNLTEGIYNVKMAYYGNGTYSASNNATAVINVSRIATVLTSDNVDVFCGDEDYLVATLKDERGNAVVGARVGFALDGVTYIYTDENGDAKYPTKNLTEGIYNVKMAYYGNDTYFASNNATAVINVSRIATVLTSEDVYVVCGMEDYLVATLKDERGNAVVGARVGFALDGVTYVYTDENGDAKYLTKNLTHGTYNVKMAYYGNDTYFASNNATAVINVYKLATVLTSEDVYVVCGMEDYLVANLKDEWDNPISGARVGFALDGVTYIYTDENGDAKYPTKNLTHGTYNVKMAYYGNDTYFASNNATAVINVYKLATVLTSDNVDVFCGDEDYLIANLKDEWDNPISGARVGFALDGVTYVYTDENGDAKYPTKNLTHGTYNVKMAYYGNGTYFASNNATAVINVYKLSTWLSSADVNVVQGKDAYLVATLKDKRGNPIKGAKVGFALNGVTYITTDANGQAKYPTKNLGGGTYTVKIAYYGNDTYYASNQETAKITVAKLATKLTSSYVRISAGDSYLLATLKDANGKAVSGAKVGFALNGVKYITTDANGQAKYSTKGLADGKYTVKTAYYGNASYYASNQAVVQFTLSKISTKLTSSDVSVLKGREGYLVATLKDANGKAVSGAKVGFALNGVTYITTDANGQAKYPTKNLGGGTYTVKMAYYGDGTYSPSNQAIAKINVGKLATRLTSSDVSVIRGEDSYLVATLKDANGRAVSGAKVGFALNGVKYVTTDGNGQAKLSTRDLAQGTYNVKMAFYGDSTYYSSNQATAKITVGKLATRLTSVDSYVLKGTEGYLTATLKDANGRAVSGARVGFALNGVKYVTTDANGQAKLSTRDLAEGTYNVKMAFYGTESYMASNQATAKIVVGKLATRLTSADVQIPSGKDGYLTATLKDGNGRAVSGAKVGFALNGVKYVTTDANGQAKLPINGLADGKYTVKIAYYGDGTHLASNQVTSGIVVGSNLNPTLTSNGVTTTYGANDYLVVSLRGVDNRPMSGEKISFTVFGKKIVDTTDSSGQAKISTKGYEPGVYNVVFSFDGNSVYHGATSSTKMTVKRA